MVRTVGPTESDCTVRWPSFLEVRTPQTYRERLSSKPCPLRAWNRSNPLRPWIHTPPDKMVVFNTSQAKLESTRCLPSLGRQATVPIGKVGTPAREEDAHYMPTAKGTTPLHHSMQEVNLHSNMVGDPPYKKKSQIQVLRNCPY